MKDLNRKITRFYKNRADRRAAQPLKAGGWGKAQEAQGRAGVGVGLGTGSGGRAGGAGTWGGAGQGGREVWGGEGNGVGLGLGVGLGRVRGGRLKKVIWARQEGAGVFLDRRCLVVDR